MLGCWPEAASVPTGGAGSELTCFPGLRPPGLGSVAALLDLAPAAREPFGFLRLSARTSNPQGCPSQLAATR